MKVGDLVTHSDRYTVLMDMFDDFYSRKKIGIITKIRPSMIDYSKSIYNVLWDDGTSFDHDEPELRLLGENK